MPEFRPYEVSYYRIQSVSKIFRDAGIDAVFRVERGLDPQYPAVRRISEVVGENVGALYALLLATVSYRLAMKGEEWWQCFSDMIVDRVADRSVSSVRDIVGDVVWFLRNCPGAIIRRDAKIKRIRTIYKYAKRVLERIYNDPSIVFKEPDYIIEKIARALQVESWRKTIVFSVKMAYYALGGPEREIMLKSSIPIPVDSRVACVSFTSGVVKASSSEEIYKYPRTTQDAWMMVSNLSGIPSIHIDSIIWNVADGLRGKGLIEGRRHVAYKLMKVLSYGDSVIFAEELVWRACR